jgi:hypothetical protein
VTPQTHGCGAGRSRLVEEIEEILRRQFNWSEVMMSNIMWRYIGINVDELITYGIDPHAWIEILDRLSVNDPYMLGTTHGDLYVRLTSPGWYEVSATTTSTTGVLYFERLMRVIKMPGIVFSTLRSPTAESTTQRKKQKPNAIYVRFYVKLRKNEWPWHKEDYEIISSFNTSELLSYLGGLIDTDGTVVAPESSRKYIFIIEINSADANFLEYLKNIVYERLGIMGHITTDERPGHGGSKLRFHTWQAVQLYKGLRPYLAHPVKRLRGELYLRYYNKELAIKELKHFYKPLKYYDYLNDVKRYRAVDMLTQAAPQTHTHGEKLKTIKNKN